MILSYVKISKMDFKKPLFLPLVLTIIEFQKVVKKSLSFLPLEPKEIIKNIKNWLVNKC